MGEGAGGGAGTTGDDLTGLPHWVQKRTLGSKGAPHWPQNLAFIGKPRVFFPCT